MLNNYTKLRTIIICLRAEEANELNEFLTSNSIDTLMAHENMIYNELDGTNGISIYTFILLLQCIYND